MSHFYTNWVFWLYFAAWLPFMLTVLNYGFRSPWWTTAIGRSLLLTKVSIVTVLSNILISFMFPHFDEWRDIMRVLLVGGAIVAGTYQFTAILRILRQARDERRHLASQINHEEILP